MELAVRLVAAIRLCREYFGGLIYDTRNGNILEVDKSTFELLNLIKNTVLKIHDAITFLVRNNIIKKHDKSINRTTQELFALKIIEESNESPGVPV